MRSLTNKEYRTILDQVGQLLHVNRQEDWYHVSLKQIQQHASGHFQTDANTTAYSLLKRAYPEYTWFPWLFQTNIWSTITQQKKFFDWFASENDIKTQRDWYSISLDSLLNSGAKSLLAKHDMSLHTALSVVYPEFEWMPWFFSKKNVTSWARQYLDWLSVQLGFTSRDDWYELSWKEFVEWGGESLLHRHSDSMFHILQNYIPEKRWNIWKFKDSSPNYWSQVSNQRKFMDEFAKERGMKELDGWYSITTDVMRKNGGDPVLRFYNSSLYRALQHIYPEHQWYPWLFEQTGRNVWDDEQNHKNFFTWLSADLKIEKPEDWLKVNKNMIKSKGGGGVLQRYDNNLYAALKFVYPNVQWYELGSLSAGQLLLWFRMKSMAGLSDVRMNYRHPDMKHLSDREMELDFYVPSLNLAFEYQGDQHFKSMHNHSDSVILQRRRDEEKRHACNKLGISLIEIPFWWDGSLSALLSTISRRNK